MARRRGKKTSTAIAARQRDTSRNLYIASKPLSPPKHPLLGVAILQDRRVHTPGPKTIRRTDDTPARLQVKSTRFKNIPYKLAFQKPKGVTLCVRRQRRRETLFALKRTGKGSRAPHRRRNEWSSVKC